jgi:hypothetical protein
MAMHSVCSSKKGMSAHQLHRMLGVTYKTAWFMSHRIRHGMTQFKSDVPPLTGIVECDETYIGGKAQGKAQCFDNKIPVFALVQRGGKVRSMVMPRVTARNLQTAVREHVDRSAQLMTDSFIGYKELGKDFGFS